MAKKKKKHKLQTEDMNSLGSQLDFKGLLDQHKISLKLCSNPNYIQMVHNPSGLSMTFVNNKIENIGHKKYMLQKLFDKIESSNTYKVNIPS